MKKARYHVIPQTQMPFSWKRLFIAKYKEGLQECIKMKTRRTLKAWQTLDMEKEP